MFCECNKIFLHKYSVCLQHNIKVRTYPCDECKKLFTRKNYQCSNHTLICENCGGYTTSSKTQLKLHSHSSRCDPLKPFLREYCCAVCKIGLSTDKNKRKHKRMHTDGKRHECNICFIQFTLKHALIKHLRRKHNIEMVWDASRKEYF